MAYYTHSTKQSQLQRRITQLEGMIARCRSDYQRKHLVREYEELCKELDEYLKRRMG